MAKLAKVILFPAPQPQKPETAELREYQKEILALLARHGVSSPEELYRKHLDAIRAALIDKEEN